MLISYELIQVLTNLLTNALKFTHEGHVRLHVRREGGVLVCAVEDTGIGIEEEFIPVIFEKFSQVDSSTTRIHEGIGLGLHIVKRCTELLHGKVKVESRPGQGTIFTVTLPCELSSDAQRQAESKDSSPEPI